MDLKTKSWKEELVVLAAISWPICCTNLLAYMLQVVGQIFLGRLGPEQLAAAALGNSYFNMVWYFIQGVSTALDTLASQAYGNGDCELARLWSIRAAVVLALVMIPASLVMYFSEVIMVHLFGLPIQLCAEAALFVQWLIPGTWCWAFYLCLQKFQQSQNCMLPSMVVALFANVINVGLNYLFMDNMGMGFIGSPIATSVARFAMVLILAAYVKFMPVPALPPGIEPLALRDGVARTVFDNVDVFRFVRLGLSGGVMMALEAWMFEMMTVFAGHVGDIALDAHNILLLIAGFFFLSFPLGISIAATIRVGNLVGAGEAKRARRAAKISIVAGGGFMTCAGVLMYCLRFELGSIFSNAPDVIDLTARLAPICALFSIWDGLQGVLGGVFRGLGRQAMIAKMNLFSFWVVGVPLGWALCFKAGMGVFGLWWALAIGLGVLSLIYVRVWCGVDWNEEVSKVAREAEGKGQGLGDELLGENAANYHSIN
jgi:MATE family multidrug resistance protein